MSEKRDRATATEAKAPRLSWPEMRDYWERHTEVRARVDYDADPDALGNVCHTGRPLWLNRYYARFQAQVFHHLLSLVPPPSVNSRALDVGCGGARWTHVLADRGYSAVGIDLQGELIDRNRVRYPEIEFHRISLQEFTADEPFDLVSSVTVIQHLPFEQQTVALKKMREFLHSGGHALILENVLDQSPNVFARSVQEWRSAFNAAGFSALHVQPYDYSPCLRLAGRLARMLKTSPATSEVAAPTAATLHLPRDESSFSQTVRAFEGAKKLGLRAATTLDRAIEPVCIRFAPPISSVHCGFVFRAV